MKRQLLLTMCLALSGCATSSGVVPMDHGVYMVTAKHAEVGFGEAVNAQADVYKEAAAMCNRLNKDVETVKLDTHNATFGRPGSANLQFRCVDKR